MVHHTRGLRDLLQKDSSKRTVNEIESIVDSLASDIESSEARDIPFLSDSDQAMLRYCSKLTIAPSSMTQADVDELKSLGFDDLAIHDIACCVGYFAFVNRIANGLGVELEN
ncbi:MAG: hypothetical protein AAGA30_01380 [Planctomycetota bacterium]